MLDIGLHQGSSLHCHTPEVELRLATVVSQSGHGPTLETLWQMCSHLRQLGYPVIVLDGTADESDDAPGLQQLLAHAPWGDSSLLGAGAHASSIAVLPAMQGLRTLAFHGLHLQQPLEPLQALFRQYTLVVLYAPVATLASPLLAGTTTAPLLVMPPGHSGVVESYKQLKHLLVHAGMVGTVACVTPHSISAQRQQASEGLHALRQCAEKHLGQHIGTTIIHADNPQDLQRLALQLLEKADTLSAPAYVLAAVQAPFVSSHRDFFQGH